MGNQGAGRGGEGQYEVIFPTRIAKTIFGLGGGDFASISIATQIPEEELRQLYSNENYRLRDKDKEKYLMVFLLQICCEKPDNDGYYKALLESLIQHFKIPLEAIANYIGVDVDGLLDFAEGGRNLMKI